MINPENIEKIAQLAPDFLGFIFWENSKRFLNEKIPEISKDIQKVGVFVNADLDEILSKIEVFQLDLVQLHGDESVAFCSILKEKSNVKIIKVFAVSQDFSMDVVKPFDTVCDFFLFDTKGELPGGNGVTFDWDILKKYKLSKPIFLSGGIGLNEIDEILKLDLPIYAIDLNSKMEIKPGLKNVDMCKEVIGKIKNIMSTKKSFQVDDSGFYGNYGGAFIPEMLHKNVEELRQNYLKIISDTQFQKELEELLTDYAGRPTPLYFARRLSEQYQTNIYLKREDLCHTGAHKINNTLGQILVAQKMGKKRIIAETGAGQHGVATATVCALLGLECIVYMGEVDVKRQALNVARMRMLGAEVRTAHSGSKTLKDATNEAIRDWISNPENTYYIIGSVVGPHPYPDMVAKFQSVISKEIQKQLLLKEGRSFPDYVIASVGGGSNAAGAFYHFLNNKKVKLVAVEAAGLGLQSGKSAATTALGKTGIIHGSKTILMQTKDGQIVEPHSISAGLDYPGIGPIHAHLFETGRAVFKYITDEEAMKWGQKLSVMEGIIPAIESAHAFAVLDQMKFKKSDVVVINLSGRGDKDMNTYIDYLKL